MDARRQLGRIDGRGGLALELCMVKDDTDGYFTPWADSEERVDSAVVDCHGVLSNMRIHEVFISPQPVHRRAAALLFIVGCAAGCGGAPPAPPAPQWLPLPAERRRRPYPRRPARRPRPSVRAPGGTSRRERRGAGVPRRAQSRAVEEGGQGEGRRAVAGVLRGVREPRPEQGRRRRHRGVRREGFAEARCEARRDRQGSEDQRAAKRALRAISRPSSVPTRSSTRFSSRRPRRAPHRRARPTPRTCACSSASLSPASLHERRARLLRWAPSARRRR